MNATMRRIVAGVAGTAAVLLAAAATAATPVPSGRWSFVFTDAKGRPDRPIRVFTYRPRKCDTTCPIVIVMHGVKRDAYPYLGYWTANADLHKFIVLAPQFDQKHWPKAAAYNQGDVKEQRDPARWAFSAIEHLFDEVRDGQKDYVLFGHSAGAQFVQRMAFLLPGNRARVMVAANPGWYTWPELNKDKAEPYPYSLVESPAGEAELKAALARRVILMIGEKDDDPDDENLNKSSGAMKQGATRLERGENFFKAITAAAGTLGVKLGWELNEVPEKAHSGAALSEAASVALFGKR